ncbi:hypothetical protein GOODEAATRI_016225 [Goodea atripinnis]|uniref:Uncharacterized protein n=1 Tax=Goodea atripinnis TaxID=208336 RepID=A0ABV0NB35_9TELE
MHTMLQSVPTHHRMRGDTNHLLASRSEDVVVGVGVFNGEAVTGTVSRSWASTDGLFGFDVPYNDAKKHTGNTFHISCSSDVHPAAVLPAWRSDLTGFAVYLPSSLPPRDTRYLSLGEKATASTLALWSSSWA